MLIAIFTQAIHRMERFPPADSVECTIPFTRALYAQLVAQRFVAPKPFRMPAKLTSTEFRKAELGMKLACGMEMLVGERPTRTFSNAENLGLDTYKFEVDDDFVRFKDRLTQLGYFKVRDTNHLLRIWYSLLLCEAFQRPLIIGVGRTSRLEAVSSIR